MEGITAKKAVEILREEARHQDDQDMARNTLPTDNGKECWHCHKKGHVKEDCWLLYPEKKKEKQETKTYGAEQDRGW